MYARIDLAAAIVLLTSVLVSGAAFADGPASDAIADRLAGAIRFETISPEDPADFRSEPFVAHEAYLRETYPRVFDALDLEHVNEYTLLLRWEGKDDTLKPALFMSHTDVVPVSAAAAEQWSQPPYGGVIADGYVWGRGALDVKTGVIFWLEAVDALLAEGVTPARTIYLAFGHDEEIGGTQGAKLVAELLAERGIRLAMLFDEGGFMIEGHPLVPDRVAAAIMTAEKAYMNVRLRARGVSGHSSMPPRSTAIGQLARAIERIESNPMPARFTMPVREMLEAAAPFQPFGRRFAFGNLWLTGSLVKSEFLKDDLNRALLQTTFAVTLVSGGVKANVIPELAEALVNVRILPGDTHDDVLAHFEKVIDDPEIEIVGERWGTSAPPASASGPAFQLAKDSVLAEIPDAVVMPGLVPGATDTRHFGDVADEILRFVPMQLEISERSGAHGRDERILIEPLARSVRIATGMVRRAASGE
ncbi:MAG: M20/M25/M40 family metallo-hydrolase [bacterium]|nr:M20/M25/M40 family metallo-hydrolase [bacterium]